MLNFKFNKFIGFLQIMSGDKSELDLNIVSINVSEKLLDAGSVKNRI